MTKTMTKTDVKVDEANYWSIEVLDKLGIEEPSQHQIDFMMQILQCVSLSKDENQSIH